MSRYIINGYNNSNSDFTIEIEINFDLGTAVAGERRYNRLYNALKPLFLDSDMPSDYLEVFDWCDFESRDDLADNDDQVVWLAESIGCENCNEEHGSNDYIDGCNDAPHGGYMLTFDKVDE